MSKFSRYGDLFRFDLLKHGWIFFLWNVHSLIFHMIKKNLAEFYISKSNTTGRLSHDEKESVISYISYSYKLQYQCLNFRDMKIC